jgi:tetratricopeptide (TPR) repeat protein
VGALPVALARRPRDVLVVGLGSGMTVDAARAVPGVARVAVAELLGDVIDAARGPFARANHRALEDARVRVLRVDAAQYLRGATESFDAIVSEPSNPWVAGMSDLFTRESFAAARDRLRDGGTFGAWFHAYGTSAEVVGAIVATFRAVFPRATLVELTPGTDYLLIGIKGEGPLDLDAFLARVDDPTVARMLRAAGVPDHAALLARFLTGARGTAAVAGASPTLRSADLTLEFVAPSLLYRDATAEVFRLLARADDLPLAGLGVDAAPGGSWLRLLDASEAHREAAAHARALVLAARDGDRDRALREGELAVGLAPRDDGLRALVARLYLERAAARVRADPGAAEQDLTAVLELDPPPAERVRALVRLGDLALRRRDGQRALTRYGDALARAAALGDPLPEVRVRLAQALAQLGARAQSAAEFERALRETSDPARRRALERLRGAPSPP